ncbi:hypothetical protein [Fusobacterium gastrosuis]|uniref:hypothetical protein n=1 Tax=Fusobacterium gastrosuis TaxID=1755100 RepID=UPI002AA011F9|nr:hypothetical protein [Fusobacterium gastrosuis]
MKEKMAKEEFFLLNKEKMYDKLKEAYYEQKLSKIGLLVANVPGIIILILLIYIFEISIIYSVILILVMLFNIFKSNVKDEIYLNKLKEVTEAVENFNIRKKDMPELKKYDEIIFNKIHKLLEFSKLYKILKYIPLINLVSGERELYFRYTNIKILMFLEEIEKVKDTETIEKLEKKERRREILQKLIVPIFIIIPIILFIFF